MNTDPHIDQEVEKTLQSLDDVVRQQPDDHLYMRLEVRLESARRHKDVVQTQLSFAFTMVIAIVAINLSALLYFRPFAATTTAEVSTDREELYQEYNLDTFNFYNYEISDEQ